MATLHLIIALTCGAAGDGNGFAISDTEIVTAYHLAQSNRCSILRGPYLQRSSHTVGHDLAILSAPAGARLSPVTIDCGRIQQGVTYTSRGYELIGTGQHTNVTSTEGYRFVHMAKMHGESFVGMSGAPVLTESGTVIAFISSGQGNQTFVKELADTSLCQTRT